MQWSRERGGMLHTGCAAFIRMGAFLETVGNTKHGRQRAKLQPCGNNLCYRWLPFMIKIIISIISLDSILMIKHSGSGTPNDDQKHHCSTSVKEFMLRPPIDRRASLYSLYLAFPFTNAT